MSTYQKIHNSIDSNNSSLRFPEKFTPFLVSFELENKPKKRSAFDGKYQIFLNNNFRQRSIGINQAVSMLNLRAAGKFLSDLMCPS